ncbi:MAG: hypothetical protein B7Z67_05115 [Acidiphilium sp. 21-60-14]|nr:MAG: hypothetical protein B7Z67_05115 [Acidiphilium sp. 21-60-14]OYV92503.1 MAG: hypothetical protein B7Z57_00275 [Acidiphilium sp. 37-60-79]OZB40957.1 MAG: hypothetical protein B7X48_02600 [Acidiphilium sp. 34-60-192]
MPGAKRSTDNGVDGSRHRGQRVPATERERGVRCQIESLNEVVVKIIGRRWPWPMQDRLQPQ